MNRTCYYKINELILIVEIDLLHASDFLSEFRDTLVSFFICSLRFELCFGYSDILASIITFRH